jgi:riboflavin kinase / FMN adenylyltransferase
MIKSVLTLGTFDGVHRGHRVLIGRVVEKARALGVKSVVLAFGTPPRHGGEPPRKPVLLTTRDEKVQIFGRLGVDEARILLFDRRTASTPPEEFFSHTVVRRCGAIEMLVGPRVSFGKGRAGTLTLLRKLGRRYGVRIGVVSNVGAADASISSRRIRSLLSRGNVERANALLGYPYSVSGKVIHGDHRGRRLGFPTANLHGAPGKILPRGVFYVKVVPGTHPFPLGMGDLRDGLDGLCNVGTRPTFTPESELLHCEVFLFKKPKTLYGRRLRVVFLRRIRAEKRFDSTEALQRQIAADWERACLLAGRHARLYKNAQFSI